VLTTHYLEEAEELADRLAIMHQGRIVRAGTPAEVAASQPARISFKLPGDAREPVPALAGTRASVMLETADLQRTLTALLEWAKSRDLVLGALDARPTSLEQAFLAMAAPSGNRAFLGRAVRYLVGEAGVRQFLDIGTGLPAANNTHEVAQGAAPQCRVVYVDNDPVVLSHAKALLASGPEGATAYVDADLRDPEAILAAAAEVLDFSRPVAVMLMAILQHISDQDDPYAIVARLAASVPSGSYLALSHPARDIEAAAMAEIAARMNGLVAEKVTFRTRAEVLRFFDGLELVEPGVVPVPQWRPASDLEAASPTVMWCGVGRKS
jgi:S-adenosyl methyltransferase